MAWSTPRSWSTGDTLTAALMNDNSAQLTALHTGASGIASLATGDVITASSGSQLTRQATLNVSQGGTGAATHTTGNTLVGAGTGAITSVATLGVNKGGTGAATHSSGNYLKGAGTGAITSASASATFADVSPLTTRGDILYSSSGTVTGTRLGVGDADQILTSDGTDISWEDGGGGGQTACVRVYITSDQLITTGSNVALPFAGETFDVGGFHDNVTNNSRLTVPVGEAGKYWVCARVNWVPTNNGKVQCNLKINGGVAAHFSMDNLNDATPGWNYDIYDLDEGDYVECFVSQNSGGTMTVQFHSVAGGGVNAGTTLMMHRLS